MKKAAVLCLSALLLCATPFMPRASAAIWHDLPHYLETNRARYDAFIAGRSDIPADTAAAYVNVGVDKTAYTETAPADTSADMLILCNKQYYLSADYVPADLTSVGNGQLLRAEAAQAFSALREAASREGLRFVVYSAYRSCQTQDELYRTYAARSGRAAADTYSARPGYSEHQTGLAVDILHKTGYGSLSSARFQNTGEYIWLTQHAYEYGFILRYPEGYESITGYMFEPWHWRYVGVEAARRMKSEGITVWEEYAGRYLMPGTRTDSAVKPTVYPLLVNGAEIRFHTYYFDGSRYFNIRDLAYILSPSDRRFNAAYESNAVVLTGGVAYTAAGGGLSAATAARVPAESAIPLLLDGTALDCRAFWINGDLYVTLPDLAGALGLTVGYDASHMMATLDCPV